MKKFLALVMALCMVFALCAASASADEPITLTYAEVNPLEGTIVGEMAKGFKAKVEELSGGSVLIDIQAGGVLTLKTRFWTTCLATAISRTSAVFPLSLSRSMAAGKQACCPSPTPSSVRNISGILQPVIWLRNSCLSRRKSACLSAACATVKKASVTSSSRMK